MVDIAQIQDQATRYLANRQSLSDFNEWLIAETWNVSPNDTSGIRTLFGSVERLIAEYEAGDLSIEELQSNLLALVTAASTSSYRIYVDESGKSRPNVKTTVTSTATVRSRVPVVQST